MNASKNMPTLIEYHREKLINSIIYFLKNTKQCGKTKLFKLLYFLDFLHFRETGRSVTGLDYFAWERGPVPADLFFELKAPREDLVKHVYIPKEPGQAEFFNMKAKKKFDPLYFSKREIRLLENIAYIFKDAKADDMVEATHLPNEPWDRTKKERGLKARIDYLKAIDNRSGSLSIEEAIQRINEIQEVRSLFKE